MTMHPGGPRLPLFEQCDPPPPTATKPVFRPASTNAGPAVQREADGAYTESGKRLTDRDRVHRRLRQGPATTAELREITHRFSARLRDLRNNGCAIKTTHIGGGQCRYILTYDPEYPDE